MDEDILAAGIWLNQTIPLRRIGPLNIIDSGRADVELALTVARRIQENLSPLFEVIG